MARFHAYRLKSDDVIAIDLQANSLSDLQSRMMAPRYPEKEISWAIARLNPRFLIDGEPHVMATQRMAAIPLSEVGRHVGDFSEKSDAIVAATDFLFQGF